MRVYARWAPGIFAHGLTALSVLAFCASTQPAAAGPQPTRPAAKAAPAPAPKPAPLAKPPAPQSSALVVGLANGSPEEAVLRFLLKPYTEAGGLKVTTQPLDGASPKPAAPDLELLTGAQMAAGCKAQSLNRLDWGRLDRDRYQAAAVSDCGVGAYQETTILAWDPAKLSETPSWGDFWDVARHPGRRGLQRTARTTLEIALLADGVGAGDLYRTLRTPDGLDRAFRKLDQLKPYLIWWDKPAEAAQALATGKVLLTAAPAAAVLKLETDKRHFGIQWNASLASWRSWAVPHDSARPEAAALALLVAGDLARQAQFAGATLEAPASRDAFALLPAAPVLQAGPNAGTAIDDGFWADEGDKLEARFSAWLSK